MRRNLASDFWIFFEIFPSFPWGRESGNHANLDLDIEINVFFALDSPQGGVV